jgi:uncharacterized membrane protein
MRDMRERLIGLSAMVVVCASCTRDPQPSELPATPTERQEPTETVQAPPTDSSLAIKRGTMTLAEERSTFRPCGHQAEWWVLDQSPGLQTQALIAEAPAAPAEVYVEAYGERAPADEEPQAQGFEAVFVLEEILYMGIPGETRGCDAPAAGYIVTARGNEPFWSAEVRETQMIWRQPEAPQEIKFGAPQTQNAEGAVRYAASAGEHQLELMVHAQHCRDSMSGEFFAFTAKAVLNGKEFSGCARVGR